MELARRYPVICRRLARERPLLALVYAGEPVGLEQALLAEEASERQRDREYWLPLKAELKKLRHAK
jgi:hypothetical protein